jgi:hypothetical protein
MEERGKSIEEREKEAYEIIAHGTNKAQEKLSKAN